MSSEVSVLPSNVQPAQPMPAQSQLPQSTSQQYSSQESASNAINLSSVTSKPWFNYVCMAIVIVVIGYLLYLAYCHFVNNQDDDGSEPEGFVEGQRQERDDPIFDYDVYKAVDKIRIQQEKIIRNLSQDVGI